MCLKSFILASSVTTTVIIASSMPTPSVLHPYQTLLNFWNELCISNLPSTTSSLQSTCWTSSLAELHLPLKPYHLRKDPFPNLRWFPLLSFAPIATYTTLWKHLLQEIQFSVSCLPFFSNRYFPIHVCVPSEAIFSSNFFKCETEPPRMRIKLSIFWSSTSCLMFQRDQLL